MSSALPALCRALWTAIVGVVFATAGAAAQGDARAGLVIAHGDGRVVTQCVALGSESISGAELLVRSGMDLSMEAGGIGATICRIDGEGCDYPGESCFCECQGSPCIYWSYWRLDGDEWIYSNAGAANTRVRDGDVEGWSWGPGTVEKAQEPPYYPFADLCADEIEPIAAAVEPTGEAQVGTEDAATAVITSSVAQAEDSPATATPEAGDAESVMSPMTALGILLGVLVGLPIIVLAVVWMQRTRKEGTR